MWRIFLQPVFFQNNLASKSKYKQDNNCTMTIDALHCLLVNLNAPCWQMNGFDSFNSCSSLLSLLFLHLLLVFVCLPICCTFFQGLVVKLKEKNSFSRRKNKICCVHLSSVFVYISCNLLLCSVGMRKLMWLKFFASIVSVYCVTNGLKNVFCRTLLNSNKS